MLGAKLLLDSVPHPGQAAPYTLYNWHEHTAPQNHPCCHTWLVVPVQDWVDVPVTGVRAFYWIEVATIFTNPSSSCSPVDHREECVPDAKDDGEVEVVNPDGPGGQEDVEEAGEGVDEVQEVVQRDHPVPLDQVELNHVRVEGDPVDEGDPEGDRGETTLETPGDAVGGGEGGKGVRSPYSATHHHPGVNKVVEHKEGDPLVGHVDEPLDAEGVEGGHKVAEDPGEHEKGDGDAVDDVPEGGGTTAIPSTSVKSVRLVML